MVVIFHLEGPSHECGRETRYRVGSRLDRVAWIWGLFGWEPMGG